jgi:hypothetical protein
MMSLFLQSKPQRRVFGETGHLTAKNCIINIKKKMRIDCLLGVILMPSFGGSTKFNLSVLLFSLFYLFLHELFGFVATLLIFSVVYGVFLSVWVVLLPEHEDSIVDLNSFTVDIKI